MKSVKLTVTRIHLRKNYIFTVIGINRKQKAKDNALCFYRLTLGLFRIALIALSTMHFFQLAIIIRPQPVQKLKLMKHEKCLLLSPPFSKFENQFDLK